MTTSRRSFTKHLDKVPVNVCVTVCQLCVIDAPQEFLERKGIVLNSPEAMPVDPYIKRRENPQPSFTTPSEMDRMFKFLTLDRMVGDVHSPRTQSCAVNKMDLLIKQSHREIHQTI